MDRREYILFTLSSLFSLAACGVLTVRVEHTVVPTAVAAATSTLTILTRAVTRIADSASPTLLVATPAATVPLTAKTLVPTASSTPPPEPTSSIPERSALQVAFVKEGDVWLRRKDQGARALTSAGGVSDVRISDDGQVIAVVIQEPHPQAQIGRLGSDPAPVHGDPAVATMDVRWVDRSHCLFAAIIAQDRSLLLGGVGGSSTVVVTTAECSLLHDYRL